MSWPEILAISILTTFLVVAAVFLFRALLWETDNYPCPRTRYDDEGEGKGERTEGIPLYPHPPVLVTRWGIHRDHVRRGFQTEAGCPVCYDLRLHVQ